MTCDMKIWCKIVIFLKTKTIIFYFIWKIKSNILGSLTPNNRINCKQCGNSEFDISDAYFYDLKIRETNGDGGGILILQDCVLKLNRCVFEKCVAQRSGGAAYICKDYQDRHVYASDERIQSGKINGCCFKDCYCYENDRTSSVLILSSIDGEFLYSNTVKCPGYGNEDGRGQMKSSQVSLVGDKLSYQYINLTQGYSIYSSGVEVFETVSSPLFSFCVFQEMHGSFMTYFQYLSTCEISNINYVNNSVFDIGDSGLYPGVVFMGVGDITVKNCYFVKSIFNGRGEVVVYDKIYFDYNDNYARLVNCYADGQRYASDRILTENCNFNVPSNVITTLKIDVFNCAYYYDEHFTNFFSESLKFTNSVQFSKSSQFTKSNQFQDTSKFTKSCYFTSSNIFSKTNHFTNSVRFTNSVQFSKSSQFTKSNQFQDTSKFTNSFQFTKSNLFDETSIFTDSIQFSNSRKFTNSQKFTGSVLFSQSSKFSSSDHFTESSQFTSSFLFSNSNHFPPTKKFTDSFQFSKSKEFTSSAQFSKSKQFTQTNVFSMSDPFSNSNEFGPTSNFTSSKTFSNSNSFTMTSPFTSTNSFSSSIEFTESNSFNNMTTLLNDNVITSISMSIVMISMRSVSFSGVLSFSFTYVVSFDMNQNTYTAFLSCYNSVFFIPFIINYLSPSYVPIIQFQEEVHKKTISQSQLIGITCGSVAAFFLISSIVVFVYQKSKKVNSAFSFMSSDESDEENVTQTVKSNDINFQISHSLQNEIDDWL